MSRPFPEESNLIKFMHLHLVELYDSYHEAEQEGDDSLMDYTQGCIDSTHVYLIKSGVDKYMTYEDYLELSTLEWKADK